MAKAAVAPHVDDDIAVKRLAEFDRDLARECDGFGIVAVDVEDRRLNALGDVGWIRRRPRILRAGGKTYLVVDDEVQAATCVVATDTGEAEAFPHNTLASKGGIAVQQHWQNLFVLCKVVARSLVRAHLAEDNRVHSFKMRRVRHKAHMHLDAVKFAVGAGAQMVFHIA